MKHINLNIVKKLKQNTSDEQSSILSAKLLPCCLLKIISIIQILLIFIIVNIFLSNKNSYVQANVSLERNNCYNILDVPKNDFRKYKLLCLENNLEVLLISDTLSYQSGASLSVKSGSYNDPPQLPGLSHFLEHMLFLGSKKYPKGDDYFKIITENNGVFNAYTDKEITNYFFDIHYSVFERALDIFSRFFIDPLLSPDKINKEINAVNSEYEKNLINDDRKKSQILSFLSDEDNPLNRFSTGNLLSLKINSRTYNLNLEEELIKLHGRFYTADKMKLVLYSKDSIEDLEFLVKTKFIHIKKISNLTIENESHTQNIDHPFSDKIKGSIIRFSSISQENQLDIHFIQPSHFKNYIFKTNPSNYFGYFLESKLEGGLYQTLKNNKLVSKIKVNAHRSYSHFSDFILNLKLTDKGIRHLDMVLITIDRYLNFLREKLISENYFEFHKNISIFNFELQYLHTKKVYDIVSKLSAKMINYPRVRKILDNHHVYRFNRTLLLEYAIEMDLAKSINIIPNKKKKLQYFFEENPKLCYEKWYRTFFYLSKINFTEINKVNKGENFKFKKIKLPYFPKLNKLIENKINCQENCIANISMNYLEKLQPILLNKTAKYEFWYKNEKKLDFNKTFIIIDLNYQKFKKSEDLVFLKVIESYLSRKIRKIIFKIKIYGNSIKISASNNGIKIEVDTFTIISKKIIKEIIDQICQIKILLDKNYFYQIKEELTQHYKSLIKSQPFEKAYDFAKKAIINKYLTNEEYYKLCLNLDFVNFNKFYKKFNNLFYLKVLILGDILQTKAEGIFKEIMPILEFDENLMKSLKFNQKEQFLYKKGNFLIKNQYLHKDNLNNALLKCFKIGERSYKNEIMINLFHNLIGNIFFRELRTNKQFGYIAKSKLTVITDNYFYCIYVQGSYKIPHLIDEAANDILLTVIPKILENIDNKEFNESKIRNNDKILSSRFNLEIISERYFNNINLNLNKINNLSIYNEFTDSIKIENVIKFFKKKFIDKKNNNLKITSYIYNYKIIERDILVNANNNKYIILNSN